MKHLLLLFLLVLPVSVSAFHGSISGRVFNQRKSPLAGAQVWLEGYGIGTVTDSAGNYWLEVPMHGEFRVVYQFIGFIAETLTVSVQHGERARRDVYLRETSLPLPVIETHGKREMVHESKTPAPTAVIPQAAAERAGKATIGEAATLEAGVQLQKRCSACEATEVSIHGLPGRFSLVLFQGMPLFSGLAARYILDILPVEFIDRLEVLKGASGAIWGSDAVAGAVNVLLLEPVRTLEVKTSYTRRDYGNDLSALLGSRLTALGINVIGVHSDRQFVDLDNNNIAENTAFTRNIILTNLNYYPGLIWRFNLGGSWSEDTRRAGTIIPDAEYRTNPLAERVQTRRFDLWQRTSFTAGDNELSLRLALANHTENGIREMRDYSARQFTLYSDFTASIAHLTPGISFSRHVLRDNRLFMETTREDNLGIWMSGKDLSLSFLPIGHEILPALRVDFNSAYGTIVSPYSAVKLYPGFVDLNFAAGTGFRTPVVIFESMENLPGGFQYAIRRDPSLTRETGVSLLAGAAKGFFSPALVADLKLNLFHHRVHDLIAAKLRGIDTTTNRALFYYYNLNEIALSTGMEFSASITMKQFSALFKAYILAPKNGNNQTLPFVRRWAINPSLSYKIPRWEVEFNTAAEVNGPMLVQTVHEHGTVEEKDSPIYSVLNIRLSKVLGILRLSGGVNNIWDYHQPPQSHHQRTEYFWGPIIGRELYATISINF